MVWNLFESVRRFDLHAVILQVTPIPAHFNARFLSLQHTMLYRNDANARMWHLEHSEPLGTWQYLNLPLKTKLKENVIVFTFSTYSLVKSVSERINSIYVLLRRSCPSSCRIFYVYCISTKIKQIHVRKVGFQRKENKLWKTNFDWVKSVRPTLSSLRERLISRFRPKSKHIHVR
jgi:hypothetical protein